MANKKLLGNATSELKLPAKKAKGEKKPKWQAKTGKTKAKEVEVAEPVEAAVEMPVLEIEQPLEVTTPAETPTDEASTEPAPTDEPTDAPTTTDEQTPATDSEPTPTKPKKLKVKADLKPKKLSMIKAALQVLQERKVPMTCPEMIDVMATEGLWTSPGGKTPASTLYAAMGVVSKTNARVRRSARPRGGSLRRRFWRRSSWGVEHQQSVATGEVGSPVFAFIRIKDAQTHLGSSIPRNP